MEARRFRTSQADFELFYPAVHADAAGVHAVSPAAVELANVDELQQLLDVFAV